jgi:hypothetical protein
MVSRPVALRGIVVVAPAKRRSDIGGLLRAFGGRGVHRR